MYVRQVEQQELTFVVSGKLWNRSLVMLDLETESLWSHILGECMEGKLRGQRLEVLPSVMTSWKRWKEIAPATTAVLLSRTARKFTTEYYRDPELFALGAIVDGTPRHWPMPALLEQSIVNDVVQEIPLLITFDSSSFAGHIFKRQLEEQVLHFVEREGQLIDTQTESIWDPLRGEALAGPLKGRKLERYLAIPTYLRAWRVFHPDSKAWSK